MLLTWAAELDRLEADLDAVEALLADNVEAATTSTSLSPWTPPDLGPLPRSLVPRAEAVLERQAVLRTAVGSALASNTAQRQFASRVNRATVAPAAASYLDLRA